MKKKQQLGMTLVEISVVLLILIALAGLAIPYVSGVGDKALCQATDVTMQNIKKSIMNGFYQDTLGYFPTKSTDKTAYNLTYLFQQESWPDFDPETAVGWRGPYLQSGINLGSDDYKASKLHSSFTSISEPFDPDIDHVHFVLSDGQTVVLDAWGRPIIIQVRDEAHCSDWGLPGNQGGCARLVSAGSGSDIGPSNANIDTVISGQRASDDRVLYLNTATPSVDVNLACD